MSGTNISIKYVNADPCKLSYGFMSGTNIGSGQLQFYECNEYWYEVCKCQALIVSYCFMSGSKIGIKYVIVKPCRVCYCFISGTNIRTNIGIKYVNVNPCKVSYGFMSVTKIRIKYT